MKALLQLAVAILLVSLTLFNARGQNLIDATYGAGAGDFELGVELTEGLPVGATNLVGWVVDEGTVDSITGLFGNPSAGLRLLDLNGFPGDVGAIHTTIPTIPGDAYDVAYDVAAFIHFISPSSYKVAQVSAANETNVVAVTGPTIDQTPITLTWERKHLRFTAVSSNTVVSFKSLTAGDASGVLLDNVSVIHLPSLGTNTVSLATIKDAIKSAGLNRPAERSLLTELNEAERAMNRLSRRLERKMDPAVAAELQRWINTLIGSPQ
jgi:hypothetical protein